MPYIRFITGLFLVLLLSLTVMLPQNHPFYTTESMLLATIFAACVCLMSLVDDFIMDLIASLFTAYFTQRIVVIYFFPGSLDYQPYLQFTPENFTQALGFLAVSAFAALLGYLFSSVIRTKSTKTNTSLPTAISPICLFGIKFPFDKFFHIYAIIMTLDTLFQYYLMLLEGVGLAGVEFSRSSAVFYRLSTFFDPLSFVPFMVILTYKDKFNRNIAKFLITLIILHAIIRTSKGTIIALSLQFIICYFLTRKNIPKKYVQYALIGLLFTIVIYAPGITLLRIIVIELVLTGSLATAFSNVSYSELFTFSDKSFGFLQRMGGFDWLLGVMNVGRETFPWWASLKGDLLMVLKSLMPGDTLLFIDDYVDVPKIIPEVLRGLNMAYHPGHAELFGIAGMAYVYWGIIWGAIFYFVWVLMISVINDLLTHIVYRYLLINFLLVNVFIASGFITPICRIYEALLAISMCYLVYLLVCKLKQISSPRTFRGDLS